MNTTMRVAGAVYEVVRSALALLGAAAVAALAAFPEPRAALLAQVPRLSVPFAETAIAAGSIQAPRVQSALEAEKQAVAEFIARRYRVAGEAAAAYVSTAYYAGALYSVDPVLILAVMAIESRYNPIAESVMGAKGLMQVIPKYHLDKLSEHGGEQALLDPHVNILVGTQILSEYYRRLGELGTALQMYAGALDDPASQYTGKVLAERSRLEAIRQKARTPQTA